MNQENNKIYISVFFLILFSVLEIAFFLAHKSANPIIFNRYSLQCLFVVVVLFLFICFSGSILFIKPFRRIISASVSRIDKIPLIFLVLLVPVFCYSFFHLMINILFLIQNTSIFFISAVYSLYICILLVVILLNRFESFFNIHISIFAVLFFVCFIELLLNYWPHQKVDLPTYGTVYSPPANQPFREGGKFKPNIDVSMIGEKGLYKFITNSKGFRSQKEFSYEKAENTYRILYIGDSFVAGMGVDQDEMSGTILENTINSLILENKKANIIYDNVEVIVSCLEQPATEWYWLQEYGLKYNPDLILLGLCMGNDISQSYLSIDPKGEYFIENYEGKPFIRRYKEHAHGIGFRTHPFVNSVLPEKVYDKNSVLYYIYLSNHQKIRIICDRFRKSKLFVKINFERIFPRVIISWYEKAGVSKGRGIHLFDPNHALGFYLKHQPPIISESFNRLFSILSGMKKTCDTNGRNFLVCLFPQRFQTTDDEWVKTMKHYSLNPQYFDINAPQGRILRQCNMVNIACYDLNKFFKNESRLKNRPLYLLGGDMHWNSYGHRIAGESMAKYIFREYIKESH